MIEVLQFCITNSPQHIWPTPSHTPSSYPRIQVSQTRLGNRTSRPNVELCRDSVQYRLVEEVNEIENSIRQLQVCHICHNYIIT